MVRTAGVWRRSYARRTRRCGCLPVPRRSANGCGSATHRTRHRHTQRRSTGRSGGPEPHPRGPTATDRPWQPMHTDRRQGRSGSDTHSHSTGWERHGGRCGHCPSPRCSASAVSAISAMLTELHQICGYPHLRFTSSVRGAPKGNGVSCSRAFLNPLGLVTNLGQPGVDVVYPLTNLVTALRSSIRSCRYRR